MQLEQTEETDLSYKLCPGNFIYTIEQISSTASNESIFKLFCFVFTLGKESNKN